MGAHHTILFNPGPAPDPTSVSAVESGTTFELSWSGEGDADIEKSTNGGSSWSSVATVTDGSNAYSYTITDADTQHRFRVRLDNGFAKSDWVENSEGDQYSAIAYTEFTETNGVQLEDHVLDLALASAKFVAKNGSADIQSNATQGDGAAPGNPKIIYTFDSGQSDVVANVDLKMSGSNSTQGSRVILRYDTGGGDTHYMCDLIYLSGGGTWRARIFYWDGAAYNQLADVSGLSGSLGSTYSAVATFNGTTIDWDIDALSVALQATGESNNSGSDLHGIGMFDVNLAGHDEYKLKRAA